jgi:endo-1,4-beta-xylanase
VPGAFSGQGSALPWDENLAAKSAVYGAISSALGGGGGDAACAVAYSANDGGR